METKKLRKGTVVIWISKPQSTTKKMMMGIVREPENDNNVVIEVVEPGEKKPRLETVPFDELKVV